jgi:hypothetical protein
MCRPTGKAGPPPENNDGLVFSSSDGAATITVSGILNDENTPLAGVIAEEQQAQDGETVIYRNKSVRQARAAISFSIARSFFPATTRS